VKVRTRDKRLLLVAALLADLTGLWARGYPLGGNVVVRCRRGHLFTTLWLPGVSIKSARLGWWRIQRCPAGRHWSLVAPVRRSELSNGDRKAAERARDVRLP
jgi:hypothetical protein